VAPPKGGGSSKDVAPGAASLPPARRAAERAPRAEAAPGEGDGEPREGRSRRGRRGGRGRKRGDRETQPVAGDEAPEMLGVPEVPEVTADFPELAAAPIVAHEPPPAPRRAFHDAPDASPLSSGEPVARLAAREPAARAATGDNSIGLSGIRLTRDEAFSLLRDAVAALVSGDDAVPSERVRQKAFALLGRDSESLSERNFARILRDAHDAEAIDLRKRGDAFEVAAAAPVPSVADQLQVKEAAFTAAAAQAKASSTPPAPRGMGHRSAPARGARGGFGAKAGPPPGLLLVGVVDDAPAADGEKPKRVRKSRAKKAAPDE